MRALSPIMALPPEPPFVQYIRVQYLGRPVDSACGYVIPFTDLDSTPRVVFVLVVLYLCDEADPQNHSCATYRKCSRESPPVGDGARDEHRYVYHFDHLQGQVYCVHRDGVRVSAHLVPGGDDRVHAVVCGLSRVVEGPDLVDIPSPTSCRRRVTRSDGGPTL